ncbi:mevalonate kinase, partial [Candidatus Roizmanbacteria bacterium CG_4_8_14_3_um_filter_34_9]
EHAVVYGYPCIVTTVSSRIYVEVEKSNKFKVDAPQVKDLKFVLKTVRLFCEKYKVDNKILIKTKSDFSSKLGFGSSSAVTVATIKALSLFYKIEISKKEVFDMGYKVIREIQKIGSGFDIASAIYGKTIYYVSGGQIIETLSVKDLSLVIGYSGIKADTASIVKNLEFRIHNSESEYKKIFSKIGKIVEEAKISLVNSDWKKTGELMNQNHKLLQELGVSTEKLDNMCFSAVSAGAYGAKLSGAGGGDCMIALTPKNKIKNVESAIINAGGEIINAKINV